MSDNRPPVYYDDALGKWVFRFSGLGGCEKALAAWAINAYASLAEGTPAWLQEKFDEGSAAEATIINRFANDGIDGYKWRLEDPDDLKAYKNLRHIYSGHDNQFLAEIPVGRDAIIRGHPDGIAVLYQAETVGWEGDRWMPGQRVGVEAKAFGDTYWDRFVDKGLAGFDDYQIQVALEMSALEPGMPLAFVVAHKVQGEVTATSPIRIEWVLNPPVSLGKVKAKVLRVMKHVKAGTIPDLCSPTQYPCPFYLLLHDENDLGAAADDGGLTATAEQIARMEHQAGLYVRGGELENEGRQLKRGAREELAEIFDTLNMKGGKVKAGKYEIRDKVQEVKERTQTVKAHVRRWPDIVEIGQAKEQPDDPFEGF